MWTNRPNASQDQWLVHAHGISEVGTDPVSGPVKLAGVVAGHMQVGGNTCSSAVGEEFKTW